MSTKTSSDRVDKDLSDGLKNVPLDLKILRKTQIFDLPEYNFWRFLRNSKNFLSRLPVSFFETVVWLGLRLRAPTNQKCKLK